MRAPNVAPTLQSDSFAGATGAPFSAQLRAGDANGDPLTFGLQSGALPPGLNYFTNGLISGTPTQAGDYALVATVSDGRGGTATAPISISIVRVNSAPTLLSTAFSATLGAPFSRALNASDAQNDALTFGLASGALPPGLALNAQGVIAGVPQSAGRFEALVSVNDGSLTTTVAVLFVVGTPGTSGAGARNTNSAPIADNQTLGAALGRPLSIPLPARDPDGDALTFTLAFGSALPPGTTLSREGVLGGTPASTGQFGFGVSISDGRGGFVRANYLLLVSSTPDAQGPVITHSFLPQISTRDALAALTLEGTARDVAAPGTAPSGIRQMLIQLRRTIDGTAFNGTAFTSDVNQGYFPVTLGAAPSDRGASRSYSRSLSFLPPASSMAPGRYSLVIAAQDNAGNYTLTVIAITIAAPSVSGGRARTAPSGGAS